MMNLFTITPDYSVRLCYENTFMSQTFRKSEPKRTYALERFTPLCKPLHRVKRI